MWIRLLRHTVVNGSVHLAGELVETDARQGAMLCAMRQTAVEAEPPQAVEVADAPSYEMAGGRASRPPVKRSRKAEEQ